MELEKLIEMEVLVIDFIILIISATIGIVVGFYIRKTIAEGKINNAEKVAEKIISDSKREAETEKKELLLEAKEEVHKLRSEIEKENRDRKSVV